MFIADLEAGEGFSPELRVHKLANTEIWSLTWAKDGRALFRFGAEITPGQTHIIWEAIGTHADTTVELGISDGPRKGQTVAS